MQITIEHLEKRYEAENVLEDINFSISAGEILGILGISGAGKSTLLRCLNGLENYQRGSVYLEDKKLEELSKKELHALQGKIGMIFQGNSLMEQKSVFKNVALPLECQKYAKTTIKERVLDLLQEVGLEDKAYMKPRQLSGGQKQRVAIVPGRWLPSRKSCFAMKRLQLWIRGPLMKFCHCWIS